MGKISRVKLGFATILQKMTNSIKTRNQKGFTTEIANPFIYKISWGKIL